MNKSILRDFLFPLLILLFLTLFFRLTDADMALAGLFHHQNLGWFLEDTRLITFLHHYGTVPELALSFAALCILVYGFRSDKALKYRKMALFVFLVFFIGSVLVVNVVFKQHWGRPRPNQVVTFGGERRFLPVWVKGDCKTCNSFPSGDASAGFFLMVPFFILRRAAPRCASLFFVVGIGYGIVMGEARMARGAHFASDVLWAGGIMYLTGLMLYYVLGMHKSIWWEREEAVIADPVGCKDGREEVGD